MTDWKMAAGNNGGQKKKTSKRKGGKYSRKRIPVGGKNVPGRPARTLAFWVILMLSALLIYQFYSTAREATHEISYSQFLAQVNSGNILKLVAVDKELTGELVSPTGMSVAGSELQVKQFKVYLPAEDPDLFQRILDKNPQAEVRSKPPRMNWTGIVISALPIILIIAFWLFIMRQMQSGGSAALKFGKSRARLLQESKLKVTFDDVAGADEAKEELQEVIDFLKDPKRFQALGGKIPKGVLLLGPPGTGKTLLARAVAGEAGVPFFSMSGSDFVEMFVGVGASRVRDLFEQGKRHAPCIIFIDEIDAVGRHRGAGLGGGHDEREQTLNQLLVEMDGFESNEGVILLSATNRPDVLDPALLRPGRFDRQVVVDRPDVRGREGILNVHVRNIPMAEDVDLKVLARGTPGLAGADLANLVNEAALLAARYGHKKVTMSDFEEAKDKIMMGAERKSLIISEEEKRNTAYHEAGHALMAWLQPGSDPIHKVTIIPRGRALGVTHLLPIDERYTRSKEYMERTLTTILGGRSAEEVVFRTLTNGAAHDLETATGLARKMVCEWGMSERLGPLTFGKKEELVFLGKEISQQRDYSERTAIMIDEEVKSIVETAHHKARTLLSKNVDKLHKLANALLEKEILDGDEIDKILSGEQRPSLPKAKDGDQQGEAVEEKADNDGSKEEKAAGADD